MNFLRSALKKDKEVNWQSEWKAISSILTGNDVGKRNLLIAEIPLNILDIRKVFFTPYGGSNRSNFSRITEEKTLEMFWPDFFNRAIMPHLQSFGVGELEGHLNQLPPLPQIILVNGILKKLKELPPDEANSLENLELIKKWQDYYKSNINKWAEIKDIQVLAKVTSHLFLLGNLSTTALFLNKLFAAENKKKIFFGPKNQPSDFFKILCEEIGVLGVYLHFINNLKLLNLKETIFLMQHNSEIFNQVIIDSNQYEDLFAKLFTAETIEEKREFQNGVISLYSKASVSSKEKITNYVKENLDSSGTKLLKKKIDFKIYTEALEFLLNLDKNSPKILQIILESVKQLLTPYSVPEAPKKSSTLAEEDYRASLASWDKTVDSIMKLNVQKQHILYNIKRNLTLSSLLAECFLKLENKSETALKESSAIFIELCNKANDEEESFFRQELTTGLARLHNPETTLAYTLTSVIVEPRSSSKDKSRETPSPTSSSPSDEGSTHSITGSPQINIFGKHTTPSSSPLTRSTKGMSVDTLSSLSSEGNTSNKSNTLLLNEAPEIGTKWTARNPEQEIELAISQKRLPSGKQYAVDGYMIIIETFVVDILNMRRWNGTTKASGSAQLLGDLKRIDYTGYYKKYGPVRKDMTNDKIARQIRESKNRIACLTTSSYDINSPSFVEQLGKEIRFVVTLAIQGLFTEDCIAWASELGELTLNAGLSSENRAKLFEECACLNKFVKLREELSQKIDSISETLSSTQRNSLANDFTQLNDCYEEMKEKYPNTPYLSNEMGESVIVLRRLVNKINTDSIKNAVFSSPFAKAPTLPEVKLISFTHEDSAADITARLERRKQEWMSKKGTTMPTQNQSTEEDKMRSELDGIKIDDDNDENTCTL